MNLPIVPLSRLTITGSFTSREPSSLTSRTDPTLDITRLEKSVHIYYHQGLSLSTQRSYGTGQARYYSFCQQLNCLPLPSTEQLFVAHLANEGLAHSTIKVYLSALRNLHITTRYHQNFTNQLTPRVEQVLQGIKWTQTCQSSPKMRLPITIQLTRRIKMALLQEPHSYDIILLWATCCIAFFGFLRCSEFTVPSIQEYNPSAHLSFDDVSINCTDSPSAVQIHIKQSKTDPFRKSVYLCLRKTDTDVCPVKAILPYMVI